MSSGGSKSKQSYTTGYRYYMGQHQVLCHNADSVTGLMVGDKLAWSGTITSGRMSIAQYNIFGGESSEGGICGDIDILDGSSTQGFNDYLADKAPAPQPAYRGVFSAVLRQFMVAAVNPYLKPWKWLVNCFASPWQPTLTSPLGTQVSWDTNKTHTTYHTWITTTNVVTGKNPIHIIWEVITSKGGTAQWGLGHDVADIDDASFVTAAQTLFNEGIGLNAVWASDTTANDFIDDILGYIDGVLFVHPKTGLFTIKLFRGGYDESSLVVLNTSNISNINTFVRTAYGELVNQVIVKWVQTNIADGDTETNRTVIVENLAAKAIQGGTVSKTIDCPYITNSGVAQTIAERYLRQLSFPLASVEIVGNRSLSSIVPGDAIKLTWPDYGIDSMVFRVIKASYGEIDDGKVTLSCTEDFCGLGFTTFSGAGVSGWDTTSMLPEDATYRYLEELPYYIAVNQYYTEEEIQALDETSGAVMTYIAKPTSVSLDYELYEYSSSEGSYIDRGGEAFTPTGTLVSQIAQAAVSISVENIIDIGLTISGSAGLAQIDSELVLVKSITYNDQFSTTATLTIARGVLDTTPQAHSANARIWFVGLTEFGLCTTIYLQNEMVRLKACPRTTRGELTLASASENDKTLAARLIRPYAPANVTVNGSSFPSALSDNSDIVIAWDNRNRLTQTGYVVEQNAGNTTPEDSTTINIYLYDTTSNSLISTTSGISSSLRSWTYPIASELNDRGPLAGNQMYIQVESQRNGFASWQRFNVPIPARNLGTGVLSSDDGSCLVADDGSYLAYH